MNKFIFGLFSVSIIALIIVYSIVPVNALNNDAWYLNTENDSVITTYYGCSGSDVSTCTNNVSTIENENMPIWDDLTTQQVSYKSIVQNESINYDSTGHIWQFYLNQKLMQDYLYVVQAYVCSSSFISLDYTWYSSDSSSSFNLPTFKSNFSANISADNNTRGVSSGFSCRTIGAVFSPSVSGRYLSLRLQKKTSGVSNNISEGIFNVSIEPLGIYSSAYTNILNDAIANSDLATATTQSQIISRLEILQSYTVSMNSQIRSDIAGLGSSIATLVGNMESKQDTTNQKLDSVNSSINNNWNNFNNTDLSNSDKQAPNTQDYSSYQQAENNLFDQMSNADVNNVNIAIDSDSATWVWARLTEWLATNSMLMSFLVSMLSIGIIKMALGR